MKAEMPCGERTVDLELPDSVNMLEMKPMKAVEDPAESVRAALAKPIGGPPLSELAAGRKNACVVISDFTRPVPNGIILPPLLETLEQSGIARENIIILIATGMHRPNLGEELESLVGADLVEKYTFVNHYCRRPETYRKIEEIEGSPIEINTQYLDADLKILTGLIEPHFYAGYSGGRKAILPGISSFETMKFMHSYKMIEHPMVTNCVLEGNPFHEYGIRVTRLAGADFILNVVINRDREIGGVFAGDFDAAHRAGCDMVYDHSAVRLNERADLVITSGGGYPLDATFYQISKALICAKDILEAGGAIVVACECREGLGSAEFSGILRSVCSPREFFDDYRLPENFVIDQWCAQNIYQALGHAGKVYVYSPGLEKDDLEKMGIEKVDDLQKTIGQLLDTHSKPVVVPDGPYVVGKVAEGG
ncbi:MAG: nickel-dependent lactate racemase [Deltaproteobacteria bacterium]|nr:nickel-dependent lactate racemase [Deltaproteobacteria bacterium]MBW1816937.1 nickel-dependent lactate racemase [Deltaproteobacteria bacterium]MBW2283784.1 nickel-dependent lactate racemase [Deltaproteobacteria bacterium]